jgi:hypothetical protein
VVDVHHKPRGLINLPRCLISQMHKVQHKPRKTLSWRLNKVWSKDLRVCCEVAHRTLSGAPGRAPSEHATVGFCQGSLRYNSPDCPVSQWSNGNLRSTVDCKSVQCKSDVRMRSRNAPDCPVRLQDKGFQRSTAPNPNGRADVARTG